MIGSGPRSGGARVGLDALALMVATAAVAGFGLLFWVVAARLYTIEVVGRAAAQISVISLVAGIAQLNLLSVLVRFIPVAGRNTLRILRWSYASILLAAIIAGGCVMLLKMFPVFSVTGAMGVGTLIACIAAFAIFIVQDAVLTAFGHARWVPVAKGAVSIAKLVLLLLMVNGDSVSGILLSWIAPTFIAVTVVTLVVFARLGPAASNTQTSGLPPWKQLGSFVVAEYFNNVFSSISLFLPPVLVLHLLSAYDNAFFNLPWLAVVTAQTLLWNVVTSLVAESGRTPEQLEMHFRKIMTIGVFIIIAGSIGMIVTAPFLLGLQGEQYAEAGTGLMRLLALSLPFTGVAVLYFGVALIDREVWKLVIITGVDAALLSLGMWFLLPRLGLIAAGWVYLIVQVATALLVVFLLSRKFAGKFAGRGEAVSVVDGVAMSILYDSLLSIWQDRKQVSWRDSLR